MAIFFFKLYLKTHKKTFETSANHSGIGQGRCILLLLICLCVGQVNSGLHFLFIKLAATPHSPDNSSMYEWVCILIMFQNNDLDTSAHITVHLIQELSKITWGGPSSPDNVDFWFKSELKQTNKHEHLVMFKINSIFNCDLGCIEIWLKMSWLNCGKLSANVDYT